MIEDDNAEGRVTTERDGRLLQITIDRPRKLNGFTPKMARELALNPRKLGDRVRRRIAGRPEQDPLPSVAEWIELTDPETGESLRRDRNTMPQWAGSC
ncbi:MAG: hypothetical protein QF893_14560, partial [Alphaproteobacteria bacterium]|nr:hypothetical protein [Alphaproteobacteria bacterium]